MEKISIIGHVGQDARVQSHQEQDYASFSVACRQKLKDGTEKTTWYNCTLWRPGKVADFIKKGKQLYVEGTPRAKQFTRKDGTSDVTIEINVSKVELLGGNKPAETASTTTPPQAEDAIAENMGGEDLPF